MLKLQVMMIATMHSSFVLKMLDETEKDTFTKDESTEIDSEKTKPENAKTDSNSVVEVDHVADNLTLVDPC